MEQEEIASPSEQFIYRRGYLSADQVRHEINDFWTELETSQELQAELRSNGLTSDELSRLSKTDAIAIQIGSSGIDPLSVSLIVMFAPAANRVLKDLWATVMLPRIRRRWGDDAIGDKIDNSQK